MMSEGGRILLCDTCNFDSFTLHLPWTEDTRMLQAAQKAGWKLQYDAGMRLQKAICPKCAKLAEKEK